MNILVTGGCGYTGSILVPQLLKLGHKITVIDTMWFGNFLKKHKNLKMIKKDIRSLNNFSYSGFNSIIHLANIANDPAVELNPVLSWEVNVLASQQMIERAYKQGVKHFIFASSGSVYGVKKEKNVTEDLSLDPISTYNKTKMVAENIFLNYKNKMQIHCIRPATVCGLSPRLRLDVSVNLLTFQAIKKKIINVHGGSQIRPNIHIIDLINVYKHFLDKPYLNSGCYNAGFENLSILEIAKKIKKKTKCKITVTKNSNDPRSYRQCSDKLLKTGFLPKFGVDYAISELIKKFKLRNFEESEINYTVKWMKKIKLK
jgi:nucleoside-diphosphate-sugar epimerase